LTLRATVALVVLLAILTGCGQMPPAGPTSVPTVPAAEGTSSPAASSPTAGKLTLGDLASRVNQAWGEVRSYRVTTTGQIALPAPVATPIASPMASPVSSPIATPMATPVPPRRGTFISTREVVLPDRQREELSGAGDDDHEAIAVGGELFVRGPLAARIVPGTPPQTWLVIDPAQLPAGSTLERILSGLPQIPSSPLSALPQRLSPQVVRDLGAVASGDRGCHAYGAADTVTTTGTRVDYTIAIDANDLPCFIESSVGGVTQGRSEFSDINVSLTIEAPAAATPAAVPPPLATPGTHD
jgi:hypothetical protein